MIKISKKLVFIIAILSLVYCSTLSAQTRVRFARGRSSGSVSGRISGSGERTFVAGARRGQTITANWTSGNGRVYVCNTDSGSTGESFVADHSGDFTFCIGNASERATTFVFTLSIY